MKKFIVTLCALFATAAATTLSTGCNVDATFSPMPVVDNIFVEPNGWLPISGESGAYYAEIDMPEITQSVFNGGAFNTYFKYMVDNKIPTQEALPVTVYQEEYEYGALLRYEYTISCEYSVGMMTLTLRSSDFRPLKISHTYYFRTVVIPNRN